MESRIRSVIKCTGAIATGLLLVVGVASGWYCAGLMLWPTIGLSAWGGQLQIAYEEPWSVRPQMFQVDSDKVRPSQPIYHWWFEQSTSDFRGGGAIIGFSVPFWMLALVTGIPTALLVWRDRRSARLERANACPHCGYNRTGLKIDHVCPECGKPVAVKTA
jgi:hypothetical protein